MTDGRLPFRGRKVIDLASESRPYLSTGERAELLRACPHPYDQTLDAIISIAFRTGRCWANLDALAERAKLSRATVVRHRGWLVQNGYLIAQGGGGKNRGAARYLLVKPEQQRQATPPPAWSRIADPDLRADALRLEL